MSTARSGFVTYVRVRFSECDPMGHVNNAVYLNYFDELAILHASAVGWSSQKLLERSGSLFVARKHEIEYFQPAFVGDWLAVRTWPLSMGAAKGDRYYEVSRVDDDPANLQERLLLPEECEPLPRGEILIRGQTTWAFMNVTSGRPTRIPPDVSASFMAMDQ